MKKLVDANIFDTKVLLRSDLNVTLDKNGNIDDDFRLRVSQPTISYLLKNNCAVIIMAHLGRPKGKDPKLSLSVVQKRLEKLIGQPVAFASDCMGQDTKNLADNLKNGEVLLLENLRYYSEEEENDENFAKQLANLAKIYVDDAFGAAHRAHASIVGVAKFLPSYAGLLLSHEVEMLDKIRLNCEKPFSVIMGGAKISTKIFFIQSFLKSADHVLLGGALANTVLHAKGIAIGQSYIEEGMAEEAEKLIITDNKLHLPVDAVVSADKLGATADIHNAPIGKTSEKELILDIGEDTISLFSQIINKSKTIIWNGPLGLYEIEAFSKGTKSIAEAIINSKAYSVIGGGETITYLEKIDILNKFSHVSSGGGAMLEYLTGSLLPGVEVLKN